MQDRKPSVASVTDGLAKLIKDVRLLQSEVADLTSRLRGFTKNHPIPGAGLLPPEENTGWMTRAETDEPRSAIAKIRYEFRNEQAMEIPTRTLLAIAKEIDNALLDIRATRLDLNGIASDPDTKEAFRQWQRSQPR